MELLCPFGEIGIIPKMYNIPHTITPAAIASHAHTRINYPQFALVWSYPNKSTPSYIQAEIDP